jgi:polycomb protein EED
MTTPASEWDLPSLKEAFHFERKDELNPQAIFDVKFYPFDTPDNPPIFAALGGSTIFICRCVETAGKPIEFIRVFSEISTDNLNSCAWSKDEAGTPLLCVAGNTPDSAGTGSNIKVLNVITGKLTHTLIGHGHDINDLAISPINTSLLASASMDHTIRLWSLDPAHATHPCVLILAGHGHREGLLTLSFHPSGRYILSGGFDHAICLWTLPTPTPVSSPSSPDAIPQIHYPHFITTAIHSNFVDCVSFFSPTPHNPTATTSSDLILSRAAEEHTIVLWSITGFSARNPPPPPSSAPATHSFRETRSAFAPPDQPQYKRLLTFDAPNSSPFYMRFSLLQSLTHHPILAFGNGNSKILFWDLRRLEAQPTASEAKALALQPKHHSFTDPVGKKSTPAPYSTLRETSTVSTVTHSSSLPESRSSSVLPGVGIGPGISISKAGLSHAAHRSPVQLTYDAPTHVERDVSSPWKKLKAHHAVTIPKVEFCARQVGWSGDGRWCVVVGDWGMCGVFGRGW